MNIPGSTIDLGGSGSCVIEQAFIPGLARIKIASFLSSSLTRSPSNVRASDSSMNSRSGVPYFITTPQFQTASEKYGWLNKLQGVGKMAEYKRTKDDSYVNYDIFGLR